MRRPLPGAPERRAYPFMAPSSGCSQLARGWGKRHLFQIKELFQNFPFNAKNTTAPWNSQNPSKGKGWGEHSRCKVTSCYDLSKDGKRSATVKAVIRVEIKLQACHRIIRALPFLRISTFFKHKVFINLFFFFLSREKSVSTKVRKCSNNSTFSKILKLRSMRKKWFVPF